MYFHLYNNHTFVQKFLLATVVENVRMISKCNTMSNSLPYIAHAGSLVNLLMFVEFYIKKGTVKLTE